MERRLILAIESLQFFRRGESRAEMRDDEVELTIQFPLRSLNDVIRARLA